MRVAARLIYLGLMVAGWGAAVAKNGEPRPNYSAAATTVALIIELALLGLGGFLSF